MPNVVHRELQLVLLLRYIELGQRHNTRVVDEIIDGFVLLRVLLGKPRTDCRD